MIKNFVAKLLRTPRFKQKKVESKKKYHVEYRNKKNNFISATVRGRDNG